MPPCSLEEMASAGWDLVQHLEGLQDVSVSPKGLEQGLASMEAVSEQRSRLQVGAGAAKQPHCGAGCPCVDSCLDAVMLAAAVVLASCLLAPKHGSRPFFVLQSGGSMAGASISEDLSLALGS